MTNLPENLEEMQRDILQYDLKNNPYLQKSNIVSKDKELKTVSKKIIPAINELLKQLTVYSDSIKIFMEDVTSRLDKVLSDLEESNGRIDNLDTALQALDDKHTKDLEEIKLDIKNIIDNCQCSKNNEGENKMKFNSKLKLSKGKTAVCPFKATDYIDFKNQFKVYAYDGATKTYKLLEPNFKQVTSATSIYNFNITPLELRANFDTDSLVMCNNTDWELLIYVFEQ